MKLVPVDIEVMERNDDVVAVTLTLRNADGTKSPYNLTNTPLELYAKTSYDLADTQSALTYTTVNGRLVVTDAANGKLEIRFRAADLPAPAEWVYHLDSVVNFARKTLMIGTLRVANI